MSWRADLVLCDQACHRSSPDALSELMTQMRISHLLLPAAVLNTLPLRDDDGFLALIAAGES